jgi:hypothetical protein
MLVFKQTGEPMREPSDCANEPKERGCSVGVVGKYVCSRCGWRWTPRPNSPDPPRACARCRSAYWQTTPISSRANFPHDPKWRTESQAVARRRQERRLARLRELAAEFGLTVPAIRDDVTCGPPVVRTESASSPRSYIQVTPPPILRTPGPHDPSAPCAPQPSTLEEFRCRMRAEVNNPPAK